MDADKAYSLYNYFDKWAVIGVSDDEEKFGYKIFKRLMEKGKTVYGVSPKYDEVLGEKLYKDILDVPKDAQVAVFVVNPKIGSTEMDKLPETNIKVAWLQPGTIDDTVLEKAKKHNLEVVDKCVLVISAIA